MGQGFLFLGLAQRKNFFLGVLGQDKKEELHGLLLRRDKAKSRTTRITFKKG
jgi:hypothetical protein